ncbi:hypothetical protein [Salinispora arenicola]|uniref:hypothetical protein n=1 Tax=Salinispora arenicola TaxID=168697 RepID=UPI0016BCD258|nr:hypothetical protein [Salinispora arenicola]NIL64327.1 hypothetical protein [Salinispora arenicola]
MLTPPATASGQPSTAPVSPAAASLGLATPASPPCPAGMDPTKWAALPPAQQQAVIAAMGTPAAPF